MPRCRLLPRPAAGSRRCAGRRRGLRLGDDSSGDDAAARPARSRPPRRGLPAGRRARRCPTSSATCPRARCSRRACRCSTKGANRVGFALFDTARKQLTGAAVALYIGRPRRLGRARPVRRAQRVAEGQAAVREQADRDRPRRGARRLRRRRAVHGATASTRSSSAIARLDGRLRARRAPFEREGRRRGQTSRPAVGDKAPVIHTLTLADVGGRRWRRSTRACRRPSRPAQGRLRRRASARSRSC